MQLNEDSDYFDFHPHEMGLRDDIDADAHYRSEVAGLKSILDSAEKSSIINSDILSSDANEFGFLKSGTGPMWNTKGFEASRKIKLSDRGG